MDAIEASQVCYCLDDFNLKDVSVSIPKGKMTSIVGPNGSGKSTFLKVVSQLVRCQSGDLRINNQPLQCFKKKEFAQTVTMLPQSKDSVPDVTVKEFIAFGRAPYQHQFQFRSSGADEEAIMWAMEATGTSKFQDKMYYALSGGEQQRVRIAMALAQKTEILLLDEPTTYLDISHQIELMEMLRHINERYQITIVMVLHDLHQATVYSDYMIAMKSGAIAQTGVPKHVLTAQFLKEVYRIDATVRFEDGFPIIIPVKYTKEALSV